MAFENERLFLQQYAGCAWLVRDLMRMTIIPVKCNVISSCDISDGWDWWEKNYRGQVIRTLLFIYGDFIHLTNIYWLTVTEDKTVNKIGKISTLKEYISNGERQVMNKNTNIIYIKL